MIVNLIESKIVNRIDCEHLKRVEDLDKLEFFNDLIMTDLKECEKEHLKIYNISTGGIYERQIRYIYHKHIIYI